MRSFIGKSGCYPEGEHLPRQIHATEMNAKSKKKGEKKKKKKKMEKNGKANNI